MSASTGVSISGLVGGGSGGHLPSPNWGFPTLGRPNSLDAGASGLELAPLFRRVPGPGPFTPHLAPAP